MGSIYEHSQRLKAISKETGSNRITSAQYQAQIKKEKENQTYNRASRETIGNKEVVVIAALTPEQKKSDSELIAQVNKIREQNKQTSVSSAGGMTLIQGASAEARVNSITKPNFSPYIPASFQTGEQTTRQAISYEAQSELRKRRTTINIPFAPSLSFQNVDKAVSNVRSYTDKAFPGSEKVVTGLGTITKIGVYKSVPVINKAKQKVETANTKLAGLTTETKLGQELFSNLKQNISNRYQQSSFVDVIAKSSKGKGNEKSALQLQKFSTYGGEVTRGALIEGLTEIQKKPLKALTIGAVSAGIAYGTTGASVGIEKGLKITGLVVGGLYTTQKALEVYSAPSPYQKGAVIGRAASTEVIPALVGAGIGSSLKTSKLRSQLQFKEYGDTIKISGEDTSFQSSKSIGKIKFGKQEYLIKGYTDSFTKGNIQKSTYEFIYGAKGERYAYGVSRIKIDDNAFSGKYLLQTDKNLFGGKITGTSFDFEKSVLIESTTKGFYGDLSSRSVINKGSIYNKEIYDFSMGFEIKKIIGFKKQDLSYISLSKPSTTANTKTLGIKSVLGKLKIFNVESPTSLYELPSSFTGSSELFSFSSQLSKGTTGLLTSEFGSSLVSASGKAGFKSGLSSLGLTFVNQGTNIKNIFISNTYGNSLFKSFELTKPLTTPDNIFTPSNLVQPITKTTPETLPYTAPTTSPSTVNYNVSVPETNIPIVPDVPMPLILPNLSFNIGGGYFGSRQKYTKINKPKTKYLSSIEAGQFNIKGSMPKTITGLGLRPLLR